MIVEPIKKSSGTDLESLRFQRDQLLIVGLGHESAVGSGDLNPMLSFISRVKESLKETVFSLPTLDFDFTSDRRTQDIVAKSNYYTTRAVLVPSIAGVQARMLDYIDYMERACAISQGIATMTIPDAKRLFASILENVSALEGMSLGVAIDVVTTHTKELEDIRKAYQGLHKGAQANRTERAFGEQYERVADFNEAMTRVEKLSGMTKILSSDKIRAQVDQTNEYVSKVLVRVKQKEIKIDPIVAKKLADLLFKLADETAFVASYINNASELFSCMDHQRDLLAERLPKT